MRYMKTVILPSCPSWQRERAKPFSDSILKKDKQSIIAYKDLLIQNSCLNQVL